MHVCLKCTTNSHLRTWIEVNGDPGACGFCGSEGQPVIDVARFVDHVDRVIRRTYSPDDEHGEGPAAVISSVAGISRDLARLVTDVIREDDSPGQSFYDSALARSGHWPQEHLDQ